MPDFWTFEDRRAKRQRDALAFFGESKKLGANFLTRAEAQIQGVDPYRVNTEPTALDQSWLKDFGDIVPGRDVHRGPLSGLEDIGRTIFGGGIQEPWDVLRPVARMFEAEQKYLSGPLARKIYESGLRPTIEAGSFGQLDLPDQYEDLPEIVQMAGEALLSPSTWIAPQAALKYARYLPRIAKGLPTLSNSAVGAGSKRGLIDLIEGEIVRGSLRGTAVGAVTGSIGASLAEQAGLPPILGSGVAGAAGYRLGSRGVYRPDRVNLKQGDIPAIIMGGDTRVYHGSPYGYRGMPRPGGPDRGMAHLPDGLIFSSDNPELANMFAGTEAGANVKPMILKSGTKLWDPDTDQWPVGFGPIEMKYKAKGQAAGGLFDTIALDVEGDITRAKQLSTELVRQLKRQGYKGYRGQGEFAIWDQLALRPLYLEDNSWHAAIGGRSESGDYDALGRESNAARNRIRKLDANDQLADAVFEQRFGNRQDTPEDFAGDWVPSERSLGDQLQDSLDALTLLKKFKNEPDKITTGDILRAEELIARRNARGTNQFGSRLGIMEELPSPDRVGYEVDDVTQTMRDMYSSRVPFNSQERYFGGELMDVEELVKDRNIGTQTAGDWHKAMPTRQIYRELEGLNRRIEAAETELSILEGGPDTEGFDDLLKLYGGNLESAKIQARSQLMTEMSTQARYLDALRIRGELPNTGPSSTGAVAASADPQSVVDINSRLADLPDSHFRPKTSQEYMSEMVSRNSLTQQARKALLNGFEYQTNARLAKQRALQAELYTPGSNTVNPALSPARVAALQAEINQLNTAGTWEQAAIRIRDYLEKARGFRLWDDDTSFVLTEYHRLLGLSQHMANGAADQITAGVNMLDRAGTLQRIGATDYWDLVQNYRNYYRQLTPEEVVAFNAIVDPVTQAIQVGEAFGLAGLPKATTLNGYHASIQPKTEPPVRQRFRARQPVTQNQPFTNPQEAAALGIASRDFIESQQAFTAQVYRASADKWAAEKLEPSGARISELEPQDLRKATAEAKYLSRRATHLDRALSYAVSEGSFQAPRNVPSALKSIVDQANAIDRGANRITRKADRIAAYRSLRQTARAQFKLIRSQTTQAESKLAAVRSEIVRAGGTSDYPINFNGRYYPEEVGLQLQKLAQGPQSDYIQRFNNLVRPFIATMDASFAGVQGLMGLSRNPRAYGRALAQAFNSQEYDRRILAHRESGVLDDFLGHDGVLLSRNDLGEFLRENEFSFGPTLRKLPIFAIPDAWFTRFGNGLRLELYSSSKAIAEAYPEGAQREAAKRALARNVSLATGFSPNPGERWQNVALFAPRFFRAQLGLLSDAIAPGSAHKLARSEARKAFAGLLVGGMTLVAAVNTALGNNDDYNWYEPYVNGRYNPNFMRMRIGGQDISPFGPWDTLVRGVAQTYENGFDPGRGLAYLARSKASPAFQRMWDLASGETFAGDELQFGSTSEVLTSAFNSVVKQSLPISVQNAAETFSEQGISPSIAAGLASESFGLKTTPVSERERRDMLALDQFNRHWRDLEPYQQSQLREKFPDETVLKARSERDKALEHRRAIGLRYGDELEQLDATTPPGPEWVEGRQDIMRRQAGAYEQWEQMNLDVANSFARRAATDPNQAALDSYYGVFRTARSEDWTPDELALALDRVESSWTAEQTAYVKRNTGLRDTATTREYKQALSVLEPYFEIEDQVWSRINNRPGMESFASFNDWYQAEAARLQESGVPIGLIRYRLDRLPVTRQMNSLTRQLKERYRRTHPQADAELVKWYGATPIRLQR